MQHPNIFLPFGKFCNDFVPFSKFCKSFIASGSFLGLMFSVREAKSRLASSFLLSEWLSNSIKSSKLSVFEM